MGKKKLIFREENLNNFLKKEMYSSADEIAKSKAKIKDVNDLEIISGNNNSYISPIFSMNEDEILAFVEEFQVNELATLSVAELNHIGKVLGVDPKILTEGVD
ncbi:hypothetical protein IJ670_02195 [bacterium]|nr:hypothetical protein [bacterium]